MSKTQTYPSDLTDEQWQVIRPLLPKRKIGKAGRPRIVDPRNFLDAIFYILRAGCPWRLLPHDFPPWGTVSSQFCRWRKSGLWQKIHDALRRKTRMAEGREPLPSVGIIDSQSVKTTEAGGPRGYDGGKKVTGRKRHLLVDTMGLVLAVVITTANVQDYEGAKLLFDNVGWTFRRLKTIYADSIYVCNGLVTWLYCRWLRHLEIVKRPARTRLVNQIRHILRRHNLQWEMPTKRLPTLAAIAWLKQVVLPEIDRLEMNHLLTDLERVQQRLKELEQVLAQRCGVSAEAVVLASMPGVSYFTAVSLACRVGRVERFARSHSLANYWGLTPGCRNSGENNQRLGSITKAGSGMARWLLAQVTHKVLRKDPQLRDWYKRIKRRRGASIARVAVMRKLATIIWHMLSKKRSFAECRERAAT